MIHITDQQSDIILDVITDDYFWDDNRQRKLSNLDVFDFTTFADKEFSQYLTKRNRIIIPNKRGGLAEFIIEENEQTISREKLIFSTASYLELDKQKTIDPTTLQGATLQTAADFVLTGTELKVGKLPYVGIRTITIEEPTGAYKVLKKIAAAFSVELDFRVETNGNKVTDRYADFVEKVGAWRGREVVFGKDLVDIKRNEKTNKVVTSLRGFSPADSGGNRKVVTISDKEALQRWGRDGRHLIEDYYPESTDQDMTLERLTTLTEKELQKRINSVITYSATMADLANELGIESDEVYFGDEIKIKDEKFNPPLYLTARIFETTEGIKKDSVTKVKLGDFVELTEEEVFASIRKLKEQIAIKIDNARLVEYAEKKIVKSVSAPTDTSVFWLDTSVVPNVLMSHNGTTWVKATPTQASEVGSYSTAQVDNKLTSYVGTTLYDNDMQSMQAQIDNQITSHFKAYEPSLTNLPASDWTDNAEKDKHIGDLFYNSSTGYSYRFMLDNTVYKWTLVRDEGIAKALQDAADAQDTADGKRRVFVAQPTTPYDAGDLWDNGGKVYRSTVTKTTSATFSVADWYLIGDVTGENTAIDTDNVGGRPSSDIEDKAGAQSKADTAEQNSKDYALSLNGLGFRYIRDWLNGSTSNVGSHWVEIKAMRGNENVALNKTVTGTGTTTNIALVTDGNTATDPYDNAGPGGPHYREVDLGAVYDDIDYLHVWHYWSDGRTYYGTKTEVSEDGVNWIPLFNSALQGTYAETSIGNKIYSNPSVATALQTQLWAYSNTTYIDGGNIYTDSVTANEIDTTTITIGSNFNFDANYDPTTKQTADNRIDNMLSNANLPYTTDFVVYGDADKYYPVYIWNGNQDLMRTIKIWRSYSEEPAPDTWNTSTHKGSLMLTWKGNFGGWGGASYTELIEENSSQYTTLLADCYRGGHSQGYIFMLRGGGTGGAIYHLESDQSLVDSIGSRTDTSPVAYYNGLADIVYDHSNDSYDVYAEEPVTTVNTAKLDAITVTKNQVAQSKADSAEQNAKDYRDLWAYPGTTYINGGDIYTNTVTANEINVSSLSAITADLGTVTAGSLTSNTIIDVGTDLSVGDNIYLGDQSNDNTVKRLIFNTSARIQSTTYGYAGLQVSASIFRVDEGDVVLGYTGSSTTVQGDLTVDGDINGTASNATNLGNTHYTNYSLTSHNHDGRYSRIVGSNDVWFELTSSNALNVFKNGAYVRTI